MLRGADKDEAIKLYKPLVSDADPVVRSKASGQLSRLVPPPPTTAAVTPTPMPDPAPPVDDTLPNVKLAFDEATAVAAEAKTANGAFESLAVDLSTTTAAPARDDTTTKHVEELATNLGEAASKLEALASKLEAAAKTAADTAGASPSPDAAKLVDDAKALAQGARIAATAARGKTADAAAKARKYVTTEAGDRYDRGAVCYQHERR